MRRLLTVPALLATAAVALTGCAQKSSPTASAPTTSAATGGTAGAGSGATSSSAATCSPTTLATRTKGTFTVATDDPAYEPWFVDDKPTNGKGYESAVAYAVAQQLGYARSDVKWVKASFTSVIAPTPKNFDVDVNQVSITAARAKVVDFSSGYYDVAQAVITLKGSKLAGVTSLAGLRGAKLGAQIGTTSYTAITDQIRPSSRPAAYNTNDLAVQALKSGLVQGLVVDLPTALYITAAELDNGVVVGQLPQRAGAEQFGMVLSKGSPLTSCVTQAVDALRSRGTLAALQKQWLTTSAGAPLLS